jgi:hypothetical protein
MRVSRLLLFWKRISLFLLALGGGLVSFSAEGVLPFGIVIKVSQNPGVRSFSLQLLADARYALDLPATHGYRHLLEHFVLKGLDEKLETAGLYLNATTYRDLMRIGVSGNPKSLGVALEAVRQILNPLRVSSADIQKELAILQQEHCVSKTRCECTEEAWKYFFSEKYLEPFGNLEAMKGTTPRELSDLHARHFVPEGLVVSIVSPENEEEVLTEAKKALGSIKAYKVPKESCKRLKKNLQVTSQALFCTSKGGTSLRAVRVEGLGTVDTLCKLMAAMFLVEAYPELQMVYTPSVYPGLIVIYGSSEAHLSSCVDHMSLGRARLFFEEAVSLTSNWIRSFLKDPGEEAYFRGLLALKDSGLSPEVLLSRLQAMSVSCLEEGLKAFQIKKR